MTNFMLPNAKSMAPKGPFLQVLRSVGKGLGRRGCNESTIIKLSFPGKFTSCDEYTFNHQVREAKGKVGISEGKGRRMSHQAY